MRKLSVYQKLQANAWYEWNSSMYPPPKQGYNYLVNNKKGLEFSVTNLELTKI